MTRYNSREDLSKTKPKPSSKHKNALNRILGIFLQYDILSLE